MYFLRLTILKSFLLLQGLILVMPGWVMAAPAIAILADVEGEVSAGLYKKMKPADNGTMIWSKHRIRNGENAKSSVLLEDGSRLRLFSDSEIGVASNKTGSSRWARYKLYLRAGSLWGKFVRGKDSVELVIGKIRIKLSDATARITRKKTGINISVNAGLIKVFNQGSSVVLKSGQRLYQIQNNDYLPQKVSLIPNLITLKLIPEKLTLKENKIQKLKLLLQVTRLGSDRPSRRSGPVSLLSDYYNLDFPKSIRLNRKGAAKVILQIAPPSSLDRTFDNILNIHAVMDQRGFDDVRDGKLKIDMTPPES